MKIDCQILAIGLWRQRNFLDQNPLRLLGFFLSLGIRPAKVQLADAGPIGLRHRRMKPHRVMVYGNRLKDIFDLPLDLAA